MHAINKMCIYVMMLQHNKQKLKHTRMINYRINTKNSVTTWMVLSPTQVQTFTAPENNSPHPKHPREAPSLYNYIKLMTSPYELIYCQF